MKQNKVLMLNNVNLLVNVYSWTNRTANDKYEIKSQIDILNDSNNTTKDNNSNTYLDMYKLQTLPTVFMCKILNKIDNDLFILSLKYKNINFGKFIYSQNRNLFISFSNYFLLNLLAKDIKNNNTDPFYKNLLKQIYLNKSSLSHSVAYDYDKLCKVFNKQDFKEIITKHKKSLYSFIFNYYYRVKSCPIIIETITDLISKEEYEKYVQKRKEDLIEKKKKYYENKLEKTLQKKISQIKYTNGANKERSISYIEKRCNDSLTIF